MKIALIVTSFHALVLILLTVGRATPLPQAPPPIVVSTIKLRPPPPKPKPRAKPKAKPKPIAKAKPKAKPKPKPRAKPKADKKLQNLVAKAQQSIAKIEASPDKQSAPIVAVDSYAIELAERLRLLLRLPAYGAVRVELTLGRNGGVMYAKVLKTHSEANRDYVVEALAGQCFAPFGGAYPGEKQHTFTLTFANE